MLDHLKFTIAIIAILASLLGCKTGNYSHERVSGFIAGGQSNMAKSPTVGSYFKTYMESSGNPIEVFETAVPGSYLHTWMPTEPNFQNHVRPLHKNKILGVLWWQGEGDACDFNPKLSLTYEKRLIELIKEWRIEFGNVPFYIVQLETHPTDSESPCPENQWKRVQDAQAKVADRVPKVYLIQITDITFGQLHPTYAYPEVARRLALAVFGQMRGNRL